MQLFHKLPLNMVAKCIVYNLYVYILYFYIYIFINTYIFQGKTFCDVAADDDDD